MSVISVEVQGITDIGRIAAIYCATLGKKLGKLLLRQTLMQYLKLHEGTPLCAEIHQQGLLGQVDMVIPNTVDTEARFEMFNKQPARYLYHVLPTFGASPTFIQEILRWSMYLAIVLEVPQCTWDSKTGILQPPRIIKLKDFFLMYVPFPSSRTSLR